MDSSSVAEDPQPEPSPSSSAIQMSLLCQGGVGMCESFSPVRFHQDEPSTMSSEFGGVFSGGVFSPVLCDMRGERVAALCAVMCNFFEPISKAVICNFVEPVSKMSSLMPVLLLLAVAISAVVVAVRWSFNWNWFSKRVLESELEESGSEFFNQLVTSVVRDVGSDLSLERFVRDIDGALTGKYAGNHLTFAGLSPDETSGKKIPGETLLRSGLQRLEMPDEVPASESTFEIDPNKLQTSLKDLQRDHYWLLDSGASSHVVRAADLDSFTILGRRKCHTSFSAAHGRDIVMNEIVVLEVPFVMLSGKPNATGVWRETQTCQTNHLYSTGSICWRCSE